MIDWNDPAARARHIETVGPGQYHRDQKAHIEASTVEVVNGYGIRPVGSRFGRVFLIEGTKHGHPQQERARDVARGLPPGPRAAAPAATTPAGPRPARQGTRR